MTQDLGPEDEAAQSEHGPADEQGTAERRSTVWPWVALAILILLLLLFLCQYLGGADRRSGSVVPATTTESSMAPVVGEETTETTSQTPDEVPLVPDVVGMTRFAAISAIEAAGFRASATDVYGTTRPADTVFQQHPSAGSALNQGGTVGVLVQARSRPTVTVPDLYGLKRADAERRIRALGLRVVVSYAPRTSTKHVGRTYSQWPLAGRQIVVGGEIQIQITVKP